MMILWLLCFFLFSCTRKEDPDVFSERRFLFRVESKEVLTPLSVQPFGEPPLIAFSSTKHVDISEARRIMVMVFFCLEEEPLTTKPLLAISFLDPLGQFISDGFISQVVLRDNELLFYIHDKKINKLRLHRREEFSTSFGRAFGYDAIWECP